MEIDVAIVGGGASGVLVAAHLIRATKATRQSREPLRVLVVDAGPGRLGAGIAYRTEHPAHQLNVRAHNMSAYHEDPDDFVRWLAETGRPGDANDFASRRDYGDYLLAVSRHSTQGCALARATGRVTTLTALDDGWRLSLDSGLTYAAGQVVLAVGGHQPSQGWAPQSLRCAPHFVADPWQPDVLRAIGANDSVLLVGTGLTMVDVAVSLDAPGRRLHALSRHGLLPHRHTAPPKPSLPVAEPPEPNTLVNLRVWLAARVHTAIQQYGDWRPAIDGVRPITSQLWQALSDQDRREFLDHDVRFWEVARHRMAPEAGERIAAMRREGRLTVTADTITHAVDRGDHIELSLAGGQRCAANWVINCTGPEADLRRSADPLLAGLLDAGVLAPGPAGLGLDTDEHGQVRDKTGALNDRLWTLGGTRRGQLWESTAIPEIRTQAHHLAQRLLAAVASERNHQAELTHHAERKHQAERNHRADRPTPAPRDPYGLILPTTSAAAEHYNDALIRVLGVKSGATECLRLAIAEDPDFALAHAALALLEFENGSPDAAQAALRDATAVAAGRRDERERSFVSAVEGRVRPTSAPNAPLLRHIEDFPRDALVVNACVPSIAFAGITELPEQAWSMVERLSNVYGDDWWYVSLLAFVRQEQRRWADAQSLAQQALVAEPGSGHAAHALTHVFYETGEHEAGLCWLDEWIRQGGRDACHQAHFSWHAALHELSLERPDAVRERYRSQLSPPSVHGMRALVDSASLLWRCRLVGFDVDDALARTVLDAVPADLLSQPATPFAAMHAAIALAAAHDLPRLRRLRHHTETHPNDAIRSASSALVAALIAYASGEFTTTITILSPGDPSTNDQRWRRLGGSDAQRDIIEETLLSALIRAGRLPQAGKLLSQRLDARPSPLDRTRLAALV